MVREAAANNNNKNEITSEAANVPFAVFVGDGCRLPGRGFWVVEGMIMLQLPGASSIT